MFCGRYNEGVYLGDKGVRNNVCIRGDKAHIVLRQLGLRERKPIIWGEMRENKLGGLQGKAKHTRHFRCVHKV